MRFKLSNKRQTALVLSGGGIKAAAFHMGVCIALQEKGFTFVGGRKSDEPNSATVNSQSAGPKSIQTYVGSSAGAVISTLLAAGLSIDSIVDAFEVGHVFRAARRRRRRSHLKPISYLDIFSINTSGLFRFFPSLLQRKPLLTGGLEALIKSGFKINGLFTTSGVESYFRKEVLPTNDFGKLAANLYIVGTQLNHSRKVIFGPFSECSKFHDIKYSNTASISQAVAASASLPPVFAPYGIKNEKGKEIFYFDGEIRDTLSTHVAADHGADLIISSYSIQPYHFNKSIGSLHSHGIPTIMNQAIYQLVEQKIQRHIRHKSDIRHIVNAVDGYCRQALIDDEHRDKLIEIICKRVGFKPNVDYIYIHPESTDHEMFFADHFSLNPEILGRIVKIGFKSALRELRKIDL